MVVAYDAFSSQTTAQTADFSFTHTPVGTPRAAIVWILQTVTAADQIAGVTYGGVAMTEVAAASPAIATAGDEDAVAYCYFLGSGIPTGAQSVAVDMTGNAAKVAYCVTLTAADNTEIVDAEQVITVVANPSATLTLNGRTSWAGIGFYSGQNAVNGVTPLSSWTSRNEIDLGAFVCGCYTYNTIGSTDVTAGYTATIEDCAMIAVAVSEVVTAQDLVKIPTTETTEITDTTNRILGLSKVLTPAESVEAAEALNLIRGRIQQPTAESTEIAEALNRLAERTRNVDIESAQVTEAANKILALVRATSPTPETEEITEATNKILNQVRNISETVETVESINSILGKTVNVNEALEIVENINRLKAMAKTVDEAQEITEALNRLKDMVQVVNETADTTEAINRVGGLLRQISETVDISEFFNSVLFGGQGQVNTVDEIEEVTEAVNRLAALSRVINETQEITEAFNRLMSMVKQVSEAIEIGELVNRLSNQTRTINEIQELTEAINKVVTVGQPPLTKVVDEIATINEVINKILAEAESYGVAGGEPLANYSQSINVLLLDAVKSRWNSDYVNPVGISYPTEPDILFLNTWYTGTRDVELIFRRGFLDNPISMRSTDWRLQGRVQTVDCHGFVRGDGGDIEPSTLNTVIKGLYRIIALNHNTLIPNAVVEIVSTQQAPSEREDDRQTLWHVLVKMRVVYHKVRTL